MDIPLPENMLDDETLGYLNEALAGDADALAEVRGRLINLALIARMRGGAHLPNAYMVLVSLAEMHGVAPLPPRDLKVLLGRAAIEISASEN